MYAEQILLVSPHPPRLPAGRAGQGLELADRVLVGILRMNALTGPEHESAPQNAHGLLPHAPQVHLDAALAGVVDCLVPEGGEVERACQLAVDAGQQVEIERSRD